MPPLPLRREQMARSLVTSWLLTCRRCCLFISTFGPEQRAPPGVVNSGEQRARHRFSCVSVSLKAQNYLEQPQGWGAACLPASSQEMPKRSEPPEANSCTAFITLHLCPGASPCPAPSKMVTVTATHGSGKMIVQGKSLQKSLPTPDFLVPSIPP